MRAPIGTPAQQVQALGLEVGDTIQGREVWIGGWSEAQLTLLWVGEQQAVWSVRMRNDRRPDVWSEATEQTNWTLDVRDWELVK